MHDMYGNQTGVEVYEINEEITNSEKAGDAVQLRRKQPDGAI